MSFERIWDAPLSYLGQLSVLLACLGHVVMGCFTELVHILYRDQLRPTSMRKFLAALKTHRLPPAVMCSLVGLLSLCHIPQFHSQFYCLYYFWIRMVLWITKLMSEQVLLNIWIRFWYATVAFSFHGALKLRQAYVSNTPCIRPSKVPSKSRTMSRRIQTQTYL